MRDVEFPCSFVAWEVADLGVQTAPACSRGAIVPFGGDPYFAALNHDHDLMHKAAVAARELEDFARLHLPSFAVFSLGVSAQSLSSVEASHESGSDWWPCSFAE